MGNKILTGDNLVGLVEQLISVAGLSAIACIPYIGNRDSMAADAAAVAAMRSLFNQMHVDGRIVIGEGERDEAPMLYIGEQVGLGGPTVDIAVDPLEGTALCAHNKPGAITVLAVAPRGGLLHAPDVYMEKIAVGAGLPTGIFDLDAGIIKNLQALAQAKNCPVSKLKVCLLDRPRHSALIEAAHASGAVVQLISDGDVMASIATVLSGNTDGPDMYYGIGGAPEGVLASAALKGLGGQMLGRLIFNTAEAEARARSMGCVPGRIYTIDDMVPGDVVFVASGVTKGSILDGLQRLPDGVYKASVLVVTHINGHGDHANHHVLSATHGHDANHDHNASHDHDANYSHPYTIRL